jgi:hypothetical protein
MGLEPTTFCMARRVREATRAARARQRPGYAGDEHGEASRDASRRRLDLTKNLTTPDGFKLRQVLDLPFAHTVLAEAVRVIGGGVLIAGLALVVFAAARSWRRLSRGDIEAEPGGSFSHQILGRRNKRRDDLPDDK